MSTVRRKSVSLAVVLSAASWAAGAASTNLFKPLIMQAIDAPAGTASHTYAKDEPWVKLMRQRFGTEGPVTVTAKVVKRYKQAGCAQVETAYMLHAVRFDPKTKDLVDDGFAINLNTCRDGQPPMEAMDLRALKDTMTDTPAPQQSTVTRQQLGIDKDGRVRAMPIAPPAAASGAAAARK